MTVVSLPGSATSLTLAEAVARFLDRYRDQKHTATTYAETLTHLRTVAGDASAAGALTPEVFAAAMTRWDGSAPATWNRHLAALRSFAGYALRQEWLTVDPARLLERRKDTARGDKAIPAARLEGLLTDERNALRERVLWRMLYETAARAEEVLTLDVADLDLQFRRARTVSKGGDAEYLHWATATARLLPRLLKGRSSGPVFLADRRSPAAGSRVRALADIDPVSGRGRLSYARAEYLFKQASKRHDPHREGWTLHQLRHSALKHLAAAGRTAPELQAKSRHKHLATLGRYVRLGEETSARITAGAGARSDPARVAAQGRWFAARGTRRRARRVRLRISGWRGAVSDLVFGDVAAALREHGSARLMSTVTFAVLHGLPGDGCHGHAL